MADTKMFIFQLLLVLGPCVFSHEDVSKDLVQHDRFKRRLIICFYYKCHSFHPKRRRTTASPAKTIQKYSHKIVNRCTSLLCKDFPQIQENLMKLKWSIPIYRGNTFQEQLPSTSFDMFKFSIVLGNVPGSSEQVPIIGDLNHRQDNVSLFDALTLVVKKNTGQPVGLRKGFQVHFSNTEDFQSGMDVIAKFYETFNSLIMLNADILPGPGNPSLEGLVDAKAFLSRASQYPLAGMNIGWRTGNSGTAYTSEHINQMLNLLKQHHITQSVTFSLRATYVYDSTDLIIDLVQQTEGSTLNIWSSPKDPVNKAKLHQFVDAIGSNRIFMALAHADDY